MILLCSQFAASAPLEYFPINSQLPPVARISQPFSFVFSPQTFYSSHSISYTLVDSPSWLSLDSDARRLFGTPEDQDVPPGEVVGVSIGIIAEDEDGATTINSTLVVSRAASPEVQVPLQEQISKFEPYAAPSTLEFYPSTNFSFRFDHNTFGSQDLNLYAVSGNSAPLPSWIKFNADDLSFSGTSPPFESLIQPPQKFDFLLVASDIEGFSSVSAPFSIIVGVHELITDVPVIKLNATPGTPFYYDDLPKVFKLDNKPLEPKNVSSITTTGLPDWLRFDSKTWGFSGTPGPSANSSNVTVTVTDNFADLLNVTLAINIDTALFRSDLPSLNLTAGGELSFNVKPYLRDPSDVELAIESPQATWVRLDAPALTILGDIPAALSALTAEVRVVAKSKSTGKTETRSLPVRVVATATPSPTATASPTSTPTASPASDSSGSKKTLVLAILLPILFTSLILLAGLIWCLRRRRQRTNRYMIPEVSAPIPGSFVKHTPPNFEGGALHIMYDVNQAATGLHAANEKRASAAPSSHRNSRLSSVPALAQNFGLRAPSRTGSATPLSASGSKSSKKKRLSWLSTRTRSHLSPATETVDEMSLLSEMTSGTGDDHIHGATHVYVLSAANGGSPPNTALRPPVVHRASKSIQSTPEFAYVAGVSNGPGNVTSPRPSTCPGLALTTPDPEIQKPERTLFRGASRRVSNMWKRADGERLLQEYSRESNMSSSTTQTTRTSILTSPIVEDPVIAVSFPSPTVSHVPSRPGEVRQLSRRVKKYPSLSEEGPIVRSPKNYGALSETCLSSPAPALDEPALEEPTHQRPVSSDEAVLRDSDTSWDKLTRRSLGIAYKDLLRFKRDFLGTGLENSPPEESTTWETQPGPSTEVPVVLTSPSSVHTKHSKNTSTASRVPRSRDKYKIKDLKPKEAGTGIPVLNTASSDDDDWSDDDDEKRRRRLSRLRKMQALNDIMATIPRPEPILARSEKPQNQQARPLAELPTRTPLADRPNEARASTAFSIPPAAIAAAAAAAAAAQASRRSVSRKSAQSVQSAVTARSDGSDVWEDIRPESTPGGDLLGNSNGSFDIFL